MAAVSLVAGCQRAEHIQTYKVPVLKSAGTVEPAAAEPTHRMLAAIVPKGDRAWFLKVVGPVLEMDSQATAVEDFFSGVRVAEGEARPTWHLPAGWTEAEGAGMRAATITIPTDTRPLELTVIALPWSGGPSDVLTNVNRWRDQMQLAPIGQAGLAECSREVTTGGTTITMVDLRGRFQDGGMAAPFASGAQRSPGGSTDPPSTAIAAPGDALPGVPRLVAPATWESIPAAPPRRAAFRVTDQQQEAVVTVIDFPAAAGPMIADPLENLNRWRREVGLATLNVDALSDAVEAMKVDGRPATYFEVLPTAAKLDDSQVQRATLAAMVTDGGQIWFFKMTGDRDLVAARRDQFRSFLESVRFGAGEGASDGNR